MRAASKIGIFRATGILLLFFAVLLCLLLPTGAFANPPQQPQKENYNITINSNTGLKPEELHTIKLALNDALPGDIFTFNNGHKQFELLGWTTYSGVAHSSDDIYPVGYKVTDGFLSKLANNTLYAQWKEKITEPPVPLKYKVTYTYWGEVPAETPMLPAPMEYEAGQMVKASALPQLEGYWFAGWCFGEPNNDIPWTIMDEFKMPATNVTIGGFWFRLPGNNGDGDNNNGGNPDNTGDNGDNGDGNAAGGNTGGENPGANANGDGQGSVEGTDTDTPSGTDKVKKVTATADTQPAAVIETELPEDVKLQTPGEEIAAIPLTTTIKELSTPLSSVGTDRPSGSLSSIGFGCVQFLVGLGTLAAILQSNVGARGGSNNRPQSRSKFAGVLSKAVVAVGILGPVYLLLTTDVTSGMAMPAFDISVLPMILLTVAQILVTIVLARGRSDKPHTDTKTLYRQ